MLNNKKYEYSNMYDEFLDMKQLSEWTCELNK